MEMYAVTEDNFDLKKALTEGKICPQGVMDVVVWGWNSGLEIRVHHALGGVLLRKRYCCFFGIMQTQSPTWSEKSHQKAAAFF